MTRETKIGLLVGLAFIIVIGILLSDHLTSSTEPPPAALAGTGSNVRQAVTVPGGGTQGTATNATVTPPQVQPIQPVPTPRELSPQTPATAIVQVGGPSAGGPPVVMQTQQTAPPQQQTQAPWTPVQQPDQSAPPITIVGNTEPPAPQRGGAGPVVVQTQQQQVAGADLPDRNVPTDTLLARIAQQHGEAIETMTPSGQRQTIQPGANARQPVNGTANAQLAGYKEYVVQSGDTVSRLAGRFMGGNTKANRDAIIRANPSLEADPNKLIVGKSYRIPSAAAGGSVGSASAQPQQPLLITQPSPQPQQQQAQALAQAQQPARTATTEYWYTVREGDTLTRIAAEQLGQDESAIPAILELNRDTIANPNLLRTNTRIRLPAKPLAQAN